LQADLKRSVPLVAPRFEITQREAQRSKPTAEVDMQALMGRTDLHQAPRAAAGKVFSPPPGAGGPHPVEIEAPRIEAPQSSVPGVPMPTYQSQLPPAPRADQPGQPGQPGPAKPKAGIEEAVRATPRAGGGGRGQSVGDSQAEPSGPFDQNAAPRRNSSAMQLLSDPKGVDFRPYMIQVLAAVRRNWQAVLPMSARMGQTGRTTIQFSIDRSGRVPKLVIAMPSGVDALDRAAVAGISASYPFPPLPAEFTGAEIRLQLVFSYNMPR
jgi:TonB family protein